MARLEYIHYEFYDASQCEQGEAIWEKESKKPIEGLPQIFWKDGRGWDEVNVWALERAASPLHADTIKRTMKHLSQYAAFLEADGKNWQDFPVRKEEQVLRIFRKHLMQQINGGMLAASTASNRMNAVIQFYRFADAHNLVGAQSPMWVDRLAIIPFYNAVGFKRSVVRLTTDLKIPNRKRIGTALEEGLLPLRSEHMSEPLNYTAVHAPEELHLMLGTGFLTGARIGTITTLTVTSLQTAWEDPFVPGVYLLAAGPGTGIATKFSVPGNIMVPKAILDDLRNYAVSTTRLLREAKSHRKDKNLLFLTRKSRPYSVDTVNGLVGAMRRRAVAAGLEFMQRFTFHQSRATFGTWLMQMLLDNSVKVSTAIGIVRDAMLHKDEQTTMLYIKFLENTRAKAQAAAAFNEAFTGLVKRNWDNFDA